MRLIDADALKEAVNKKKVVGRFNMLLLINNAPTVERPVKVEVTEHHTFAKPDDVSDLDFPGVSSEDK